VRDLLLSEQGTDLRPAAKFGRCRSLHPSTNTNAFQTVCHLKFDEQHDSEAFRHESHLYYNFAYILQNTGGNRDVQFF
jgi:hypothetical protein